MATPTRDELRALGYEVGNRGPLPPAAVAEWERRQAARPAAIEYDPGALTAALDKLPEPAARATVRFALAAIVTRRAGQADDHPGVFMIGPRGRGKTTTARTVFALLGLPFRENTKVITEQTTAPDVRGRRNGAGRVINPAPWQSGPVVFFDEIHRARADTLSAIQSEYLQGDRAVSVPTPILAANEGRHGIDLLEDAIQRRVLIVRADSWSRTGMDRYRRQLDQLGAIVPLDLPLPTDGQTETVWAAIDTLEGKLTPEGQDVFLGVQFLAPLVPAYAALLGVDQADAAGQLCADYLACAATLGHVAGVGLAVPEPTPAEIAQQEAQEQAQALHERVALAGFRQRFKRAWMGPWLGRLERVLELDRLDYLWDDAIDLGGQGEQLAAEVDAAELADLARDGQVFRAVYEWCGKVSALTQSHDLTTPDPEPDEDGDWPEDDPNVIDGEAWEDPEPEPEPVPEVRQPDRMDAAGAAVSLGITAGRFAIPAIRAILRI